MYNSELVSAKKNIKWINLIKATCIVFVFFRHVEINYDLYLGDFFDGIISTFYVNAFFFVSGYLLYRKQLSEPLVKETLGRYISKDGGGRTLAFNVLYRIVIPSIIFAAFEFFPSCIIQGRGVSVGNMLYKTIGGGTYWFTSALAVAQIVILIFLCSRKKSMWFYVFFSIIIGFLTLWVVNNGYSTNGFWAWREGLISLIFLAMGGLYWKYERQIDSLRKWWVIILLLGLYLWMVSKCRDLCNPGLNTLTIQPLGFLTSLLSCILLVWVFKISPEWKPLSFIGQYSLGFYFMSGALPITMSKVAHYLAPGIYGLLLPVLWVICIVIAYLAVMIINRWVPWLWDLRKVRQ